MVGSVKAIIFQRIRMKISSIRPRTRILLLIGAVSLCWIILQSISAYPYVEYPALPPEIDPAAAPLQVGIEAKRPVIVTGFSSNHFYEAQALFVSLHRYLPQYPVVAYDLGLTEREHDRTRRYCRCDLRRVAWHRYPAHVKEISTYAFKPVLINETLAEFGFVFWVDSSIRFKSNAVDALWAFALSNGFAAGQDTSPVRCLTHPDMFTALNVLQVDQYEHARTIQANMLLFVGRDDTIRGLLRPWLQCALRRECIAPSGSSPFGCKFEQTPNYCGCHRFDQSALEVLLYRHYPGHFNFDPVKREGPLASFSFGLYNQLLPEYDVMQVIRSEAVYYFHG